MNHLRPELAEQLPQIVLQQEPSDLTNTNEHDNIFVTNVTLNDHQANIRRRAPTRHSIKSLTNRKSLSKQNSTKEKLYKKKMSVSKISNSNRRKLTRYHTIHVNSSIETEILRNIPSVSQIAPLPESKSDGILPILSLDRRDSSNSIESDNELSLNIEITNTSNGHEPVGEYNI
ncbi:unnamed protein product [Rotaria sp. Silwood2]|nr:unnamed protein product [Rotaria sp. Silwood2]CAF3110971.1 unnamed protein product [Rotaria sp. Silwood2]CAF3202622.1 unnamed protein product [Rotaria sp. Silwood2]CAF4297108.1 unnamed protein product [Rotaria sp. Silwood2]